MWAKVGTPDLTCRSYHLYATVKILGPNRVLNYSTSFTVNLLSVVIIIKIRFKWKAKIIKTQKKRKMELNKSLIRFLDSEDT